MEEESGWDEKDKTSLPLWERGLKYFLGFLISLPYVVAPLVGAWIEIMLEIAF